MTVDTITAPARQCLVTWTNPLGIREAMLDMDGDTFLTLRIGSSPSGCSVRPRRLPHESPKGLPGPLDIARRVLIAV
jgi:hypothetical protein